MLAPPCTSTGHKIRLPEVLDIRAAAPLAAELLGLRGLDVELDASQVSKLGAQCLQVILSARLSWQTDHRRLAVTDPSAEFMEGTALLGASFVIQPHAA